MNNILSIDETYLFKNLSQEAPAARGPPQLARTAGPASSAGLLACSPAPLRAAEQLQQHWPTTWLCIFANLSTSEVNLSLKQYFNRQSPRSLLLRYSKEKHKPSLTWQKHGLKLMFDQFSIYTAVAPRALNHPQGQQHWALGSPPKRKRPVPVVCKSPHQHLQIRNLQVILPKTTDYTFTPKIQWWEILIISKWRWRQTSLEIMY